MILNYLSEHLNCSKKQLQQHLSCTPTELEEMFNNLKKQGLPLLISGDKVQLKKQLPLLNIPLIKQSINPQKVHYQKVMDSTNQYLLNHIKALNKGDICITEYQHAGRGRRGKHWLSPFAGQIIYSLYWNFPTTTDLNGLSLVVGLAVTETLADLGVENIGLKWPNDILLQGRKLAGILIELAPNKAEQYQVVIGLGLNMLLPKEDLSIDQPYAQLLTDSNIKIERSELINQITHKLYLYLTLFQQKGMALFQQQWNQYDAFYNQKVCLIEQNQVTQGIEKGIDERGYLQLQVPNQQQLIHFNVGEVSLRKQK